MGKGCGDHKELPGLRGPSPPRAPLQRMASTSTSVATMATSMTYVRTRALRSLGWSLVAT